jgi:hypothetical protein
MSNSFNPRAFATHGARGLFFAHGIKAVIASVQAVIDSGKPSFDRSGMNDCLAKKRHNPSAFHARACMLSKWN